jgi:hypothetical protein
MECDVDSEIMAQREYSTANRMPPPRLAIAAGDRLLTDFISAQNA